MKYPLELVTWIDHVSFSENRWRMVDEYKELEPYHVKTVGWVVKEENDHIVLVSTLSDAGKALGDMCIMKGLIVKRKKLGQ